MDIYGPVNRVEVLDIGISRKDSSHGTSDIYVRHFARVDKETERSAYYKIHSMQHKYYLISNANATNSNGNRRSYRISLISTSRLMLPDNLGKAHSWAKYQVINRFFSQKQPKYA
jgi:Cu2+-containing amine oxidase